MKKTKTAAAVLAVIICLCCEHVCAEYRDFYVMRKKDHERPKLDPCLSYITEHGGLYIGDDEKVLYLTFDAGYENGNVERIVDILDKHGVKGNFFVLENIIKRNTELIKRMADNGHLIANHSLHHKNMADMCYEECSNEICGLEKRYEELTGRKMSKFFRPPEGKCSVKLLDNVDALGYKTVYWSFAYADWDNGRQPDPEHAFRLIMENTHNGAVILLHPTSKTNADILDGLLTEWEKRGYRFGTLDELL